MPGTPRSMRHCALIATILLCAFDLSARGGDAVVENVVLITLDGLRGEELFGGADQRLMTPENGVKTPDQLKSKFWKETRTERRELLMPFLWKMSLSKSGWIAGDIEADSQVAVSNGMFFSYPGYNEILTGKPDPAVDSNDKKYNANVTVLEWLHGKEAFRGKVAAYTSWDVFPFIINDKRSGIPVNSGWQKFEVGEANRVATLNLVSEQLFHEWDGVRYDVLTTAGAIEELTTRAPRVLFVGLGETDDWAHAGRYDRYLLAAQQNDRFIELLWETCQKLPSHRDKTLFIITTDHGRGIDREGWKNHGTSHPGSERIWVAAFGPGVRQGGIDTEGKFVPGKFVTGKFVPGKFVQAQVAATVAAALGEDFTTSSPGIHPPLPFLQAD